MDNGRIALVGLHQVGQDGILEQGGHSALRFQITGIDGLFIMGKADKNIAEPPLEICPVGRQTEDGHHFRRGGNVKTRLARYPHGGTAQPYNRLPQCPVVHIHHPLPHDSAGVEVEAVFFILQVVVDQRRQQVVRLLNGSKVARKMQVDVLHGQYLAVTAPGSSAFDAKYRPQRGFAQHNRCFFTYAVEPL